MLDFFFGELFRNPSALFDAFRSYNEAIWPSQIPAYLLALVAVFFVVKRSKYSDTIIFLVLSLFWLWAGIVCLFVFLAPDFPVFYGLGGMAVLQGILFLVFGVGKAEQLPSLTFRPDIYGLAGGLLTLYALIGYPLVGHLTGHPYPDYPLLGTAPCPTCILTLGLLVMARKPFPFVLLIVPLLESILGIIPSILGLYADIGLVIAGIAGLSLILKGRK